MMNNNNDIDNDSVYVVGYKFSGNDVDGGLCIMFQSVKLDSTSVFINSRFQEFQLDFGLYFLILVKIETEAKLQDE